MQLITTLKVISISVKHSRWGPGDVSEIISANRDLHTPPALQHRRDMLLKAVFMLKRFKLTFRRWRRIIILEQHAQFVKPPFPGSLKKQPVISFAIKKKYKQSLTVSTILHTDGNSDLAEFPY